MSDFRSLEHFLNPRNVGDASEPSFTGRGGSFVCGATATVSIQIDEAHQISEARFRAAGCEVLIASLSILTESIKGETTAEAASVANNTKRLAHDLDIDSSKHHCVQLARDAALNAIRAYSDTTRDEWNGDEVLICTCFFISEQAIEREIEQRGLTTVREVTEVCNAGGGCGSCQPLILDILESSKVRS